jgi:cytochrome c oxidase assembly factor CtaG
MTGLLQFGSLAFVAEGFRSPADSAIAEVRNFGWTWPLYIAIPLFVTAAAFALGVLKQRARTGSFPARSAALFAGGLLSLIIALDSPIHELSERLFWVHMTQHEILMLVSAPLLVMSRPLVSLLWAMPRTWRVRAGTVAKSKIVRRAWLAISAPVAAWLLHGAALWLWHAPALFVAALQSELVHAAQHISFLGTALLFWWALLSNHGLRLGYGGALLYVFTTITHMSFLGAWLTFSARVWYAPYLQTAPAWHLSALEDQQIGGLVMWIPAGVLLTAVMLVLFIKWMQQSQQRWEYTRTAELMRAAGVAHET